MKNTFIKLAGAALASACLTAAANAEVSLVENKVAVYGYIAGSATYEKFDSTGSRSETDMDMDAAKLGVALNFAPVTGKISFYSDKGASDIYILEANATYDFGNGVSMTGGRYQSWIGYEAFDIPNQNFITNGADTFGMAGFSLIPNFAEGVKIDYVMNEWSLGFSFVDSIYSNEMYRGDGSLSDGYAGEAHVGYNKDGMTASLTVGYQKGKYDSSEGFNNFYAGNPDIWVVDFWAQYVVNKTTFAGEFLYQHDRRDGGYKQKSYYGLISAKYQINDNWGVAGRLSAGEVDINGWDPNFWKISFVPSYTVTENLEIRAELSYTDYSKEVGIADGYFFAGIQAVFKF